MDEEDLLLGGESSGGLKIRGHVNGKDGILAALLAVEMLAKTGKTLSQLLEEINELYGTLYFDFITRPTPSERAVSRNCSWRKKNTCLISVKRSGRFRM